MRNWNPTRHLYSGSSSLLNQNIFAKSTCIALLLCLACLNLGAQDLGWAVRAGGTGFDEGRSIAVDASGNVFVTGRFSGSSTFGPGEANETVLSSSGDTDVFIAKYAASGLLTWAKKAGGNLFDRGYNIAIDVDGNPIVAGQFEGTLFIDQGQPTEISLSSAGGSDIFIIKLDTDGGVQWATRAGGSLNESVQDLHVAGSGDLALTGRYNGTAVFGPGEPNEATLVSAGGVEIFAAVYSASGLLQWAVSAGGSANDSGEGIALSDSGECTVSGVFLGTATFGAGGTNQTTFTSAGGEDLFVAKYSNVGDLIWVKRATGLQNVTAKDLTATHTGEIYITGAIMGTATFGPGEINQQVLVSLGGADVIVAKYAASGEFMWVTSAGGSDTEFSRDIVLDENGNCYITGEYRGAAIFGAGEINETSLFSQGDRDAFVAKYRSDGQLAWATSGGGSGVEIGFGVTVLSEDQVYSTGYFGSTAVFGEGELNETSLTSSGDADIFVAAFGASTTIKPLIWTKSNLNPITTASGNGWDNYLRETFCIKDADGYKLYFSSLLPNQIEVGLATSPDGLTWTKYPDNQNPLPVLARSMQHWSSFRVVIGSVLEVGDTYYAFYYGDNQNLNSKGSIGMATSADGITWTPYAQNPVIPYQTVAPAELGVKHPMVIFKDGLFHMYFLSQGGGSDWYYGTSPDGINWTIEVNPPGLNLPRDEYVIRYLNGVHYAQAKASAFDEFSIWISSDGMQWHERYRGDLLPLQAWQQNVQGSYALLPEDDQNMRLFFTGGQGTWGPTKIGFATAQLNNGGSPAITVASPNGGEHWQAGKQYQVSWSSNNLSEVNIEVSYDDGNSWTVEAFNIPAVNRQYLWTLPDIAADNCLVRISDATSNAVVDSSDGSFRIVPNTTVVITHGFQLEYGGNEIQWKHFHWQFSMADAISDHRQILFVHRGKIYQTQLNYFAFSQIDEEMLIEDLLPPSNVSYFTENISLVETDDVVLVVDWVDESDRLTHGYSEAAADVVSAALLQLAKTYPWLLDQLHFIGHSRGTVVNSEIIERLIFAADDDPDFLPTEINLDPDIHMTTLDPHPAGHWHPVAMNDDAVNSSNILVNENGEFKRTGVVGWKGANHRVKYMDNYYQNNVEALFVGMPNIPGLNTGGLFANIDLTQTVNGLAAHSLVHTWYYGTVDNLHAKEGFGYGSEIDRGNWYIDSLGALQGFYHSTQREGQLSVFETLESQLYDIHDDHHYGRYHLIFNGDFAKNPRKTVTTVFPGWDFQGGGGNGLLNFSTDNGGMNDHLYLAAQYDSKTHNPIYIPNNARHLFYRLRVEDKSFNDELVVRVGNVEDRYSLRNEYNYRWFSTDVSSLQGTWQTIEFAIDGHGSITSKVWIDDVSFYPAQYFNVSVASPVKLHAYDSQGNHTGPTSDSTWVAEIPGSRYTVESDSLVHPRQTIYLPDFSPRGQYQLRIVSDNAVGSFDFEIEDNTDSIQTVTAVFDSILIEPSTVATCALLPNTSLPLLELDIDGNGAVDSVYSPHQYLRNTRIAISSGANGSIIPADSSFAKTDTLFLNWGDSLSFDIVPDSGYFVADVIVDSLSLGPLANYSFDNVRRDHSIAAVFSPLTGIDGELAVPEKFYLSRNYPNPFNPSTIIRYGIPKQSHVSLEIFNGLGQKIAVLTDEVQPPGSYSVNWNGKNQLDVQVGSGVYFYRLRAGSFVEVHKMLLIR